MSALSVIGIVVLVILALAAIVLLACQIALAWAKKRYSPKEERDRFYPGDELLADFPKERWRTVSSAITIDAPASEVYRHIYQFGGSKARSYSSEMAERVLGRMSVFNRYELQEEWQAPDAPMPGDFQDWDRSGLGTEYADVVADKYMLGFSDTAHPPRARGAYAIGMPGKRNMFIWGFYLVPLKGGKTRYINRWIYIAPENPLERFVLYNMIYIGGSTMGRWHVEYIKQLAEGKPKVHRCVKAYRKLIGANHHAPDDVQKRTDCPIIREGRSCPAVGEVREPKMADPAWPPADGPWDVDPDYYRKRIPSAIDEVRRAAAKQQEAANLKIAALEAELAALG